jgi:DNA-binding NarL/FixJ family response regulator
MSAEAGFEGIYRSSERPKRQEEVLERVQAGLGYKRIAADLGITRSAVEQIVEKLRADGRLAREQTPPER